MRVYVFGPCCCILLICLTFAPGVSADLQAPQLTIGDHWNYRGNYIGTTATSSVTITGRTNITVEDTVYDVYVHVNVVEGTGPQNTKIHRTQTTYINTADGAVVKIRDDFNYTSDVANQSFEKDYVFTPPLITMHYPLAVGDRWQNQGTMKSLDLRTNETSDTSINESYICDQIVSESEMGRTFNCYMVKKSESILGQRSNYTYYFSGVFGYQPIRTDVELSGMDFASLRLTDYQVAHPGASVEDANKNTPGFELVPLLAGVAILILWKKRSK